MDLLRKVSDLSNKINECNALCRELGTEWEVVLRKKEGAYPIFVVMQNDRKIETIKAIRQVLGWSLVESKNVVDTACNNGSVRLTAFYTTQERDLCYANLRNASNSPEAALNFTI